MPVLVLLEVELLDVCEKKSNSKYLIVAQKENISDKFKVYIKGKTNGNEMCRYQRFVNTLFIF